MSTMKPEAGQLTMNDLIAIGKAASFLRFEASYKTHATDEARKEWRSVADALTDIECRFQPQPAEDSDEWVIQDRVPVRVGIDEIHWSDWYATRWEVASGHWFPDTRYGSTQDGAVLSVRCRRRDLPKVEQAEQWPKYYVPVNAVVSTRDEKPIAFFRRDSTDFGETFHTDGTSYRFHEWQDGLVQTKQLTEAEAMALLEKPECKPNTSDPACPDCGSVDCERAKSSSRECSSGFEPGQRKVCYRCGRMNCESLTQPQKTRVRLWARPDGGNIWFCQDKPANGAWQEIHHDSEGFYVEGGQS